MVGGEGEDLSVFTAIAILHAGGRGIKSTNCSLNDTKDDCNSHGQAYILAKQMKLANNIERTFSL